MEQDKGVFANSMKSVIGKEVPESTEPPEPQFSLKSVHDRIEISPKIKLHWKKKRKKNRGTIRMRLERRDLRGLTGRKIDDFIKRWKARREAGVPVKMGMIDTIGISRSVRRRSLNGGMVSGVRARKHAIDFSIEKLVHITTSLTGKQEKNPTGNRRKKYQDYVDNIEKSNELIRKASFARGKPTEAGGYLAKVQGPYNPGPLRPDYDPEMETTMQQAEARGEFDPWKKDNDE